MPSEPSAAAVSMNSLPGWSAMTGATSSPTYLRCVLSDVPAAKPM